MSHLSHPVCTNNGFPPKCVRCVMRVKSSHPFLTSAPSSLSTFYPFSFSHFCPCCLWLVSGESNSRVSISPSTGHVSVRLQSADIGRGRFQSITTKIPFFFYLQYLKFKSMQLGQDVVLVAVNILRRWSLVTVFSVSHSLCVTNKLERFVLFLILSDYSVFLPFFHRSLRYDREQGSLKLTVL